MPSPSITTGTTTTDWSNLHDDILNSIIHRLNDLMDFLNFRIVCRSWRSSSSTHHLYCHDSNCRHRSSKIPWLLLQSPTNHTANLLLPLHLYDFTNRKSHHIQLPPHLFANSTIKFSSNGYLICRQKHGCGSYRAVNPLTGTHFGLPPISTIDEAAVDRRSLCTVIICGRRSRIMYAKPDDCSWTSLTSDICLHDSDSFSTIIFHKGLLYTITETGTSYIFDLSLTPFVNTYVITKDPVKGRGSKYCKDGVDTVQYFVESPDGNDLFLLVIASDSTRFGSGVDCTLFKESKGEGRWELVQKWRDVFHVYGGEYGAMYLLTESQSDMVVKKLDMNHVGGSLRCVYDVTRGVARSLRLSEDTEGVPFLWLTPTLA